MRTEMVLSSFVVLGMAFTATGCGFSCEENYDCEDGYVCRDSECLKASDIGVTLCDLGNDEICHPYECDLSTDECRTSCVSDDDCGGFAECASGKCIAAPCEGSGYNCSPYACNATDNHCYISCTTNAQCVRMYECKSGHCAF